MCLWASLVAQTVKNLPAMRKIGLDPRVEKVPWRREWQSTLVFLPGESPWTEEPGGLHSLWGWKELAPTEQLSTVQAFSPIIKFWWMCVAFALFYKPLFNSTYLGNLFLLTLHHSFIHLASIYYVSETLPCSWDGSVNERNYGVNPFKACILEL